MLEKEALAVMAQKDVTPSFKGYRGYPGSICVSINEEVVHGIPGEKIINEGDIVSIDVGVFKDGYYGDMARSYPVGTISKKKMDLINTARIALRECIKQAVPGNRLHDISHVIEKYANDKGYSVVKSFVGHGIGTSMHEEPQVPNYGVPHTGPKLKAGMVIAIEPMVNMGTSDVVVLNDGWTVVTQDGLPSAHYEDTIAITENGPEILTCLKKNQ